MSFKLFKGKTFLGTVIISIGIGMLLAMFVPIWGWIISAGIALIFLGWQIMNKHFH